MLKYMPYKIVKIVETLILNVSLELIGFAILTQSSNEDTKKLLKFSIIKHKIPSA